MFVAIGAMVLSRVDVFTVWVKRLVHRKTVCASVKSPCMADNWSGEQLPHPAVTFEHSELIFSPTRGT
jgi:hypothetical protein